MWRTVSVITEMGN